MLFYVLFFLLYINTNSLLINRDNLILTIKLKKIIIFMADNQYEIDSAMNLIKEDIIRELSESVSKQNKNSFYRQNSSNNLSFSENTLD